MKKLILLLLKSVCIAFLILSTTSIFAQEEKEKISLYNPEADAKADIAAAVEKAKAEGKNVFLQIGGNWCVWCVRFHKFYESDSVLNTFLHENYVVQKVNYSNENRNGEVLTELDFPQRFGFPVFVILDENGKRIHTQDTALLESGQGYDKKKVLSFFRNWSPAALNPDRYR